MRTRLALTPVAACLLLALGASPALADSTDDQFIANLKSRRVVMDGSAGEKQAIKVAHEGCDLMKSGYSSGQTSAKLASRYSNVPTWMVMTVVSQGWQTYCPEVLGG